MERLGKKRVAPHLSLIRGDGQAEEKFPGSQLNFWFGPLLFRDPQRRLEIPGRRPREGFPFGVE